MSIFCIYFPPISSICMFLYLFHVLVYHAYLCLLSYLLPVLPFILHYLSLILLFFPIVFNINYSPVLISHRSKVREPFPTYVLIYYVYMSTFTFISFIYFQRTLSTSNSPFFFSSLQHYHSTSFISTPSIYFQLTLPIFNFPFSHYSSTSTIPEYL